ncbi:MAG: nickel pincer cofactor biosynthesis protein LarB [Candidatus Odinarchaeota archaeon]
MTDVKKILQDLISGKVTIHEAEKQLRTLSLDQIGSIAIIDLDRQSRSGVPEVVFAESKDAADIVPIVRGIVKTHAVALITRLTDEKLNVLKSSLEGMKLESYGKSPIITALAHTPDWTLEQIEGKIAIITAGTSDISYAKESEALARLMGVEVFSFYDVGVSGIHRLIEPLKEIIEKEIDAVIVFAGMEGALPTVVAALIDIPVIGVPVPTGYGFGGKGETALASMLQSCSPGLAVVNIGNGIGAASVACLIAKRATRKRT